MAKTVVVLGAGVGGLTTATRLREMLPEHDRIVLVDRSFDGVLGLSLLWVMRGWRTPEQVHVRPKPLAGIDMRTAEVRSIDTGTRHVHTDGGSIAYDALVIALGAGLAPDRVPGLREAEEVGIAGGFYTLDGAERLHRQLSEVDSGRVAFVVAGVPFKCPAAPFEGALLAADLFGEAGVRGSVTVDAFTPDPFPMPVAGPEVGRALVGMLDQHGIGFHPGKSLDLVDVPAKQLAFADGTRESFDFLVVVPPHQAPAPVRDTGLGPMGWVPVDPRTLASAVPGVWALGDCSALTLPNGKPLPKAAVFAEGESEVVANGVARHLGHDAPEPYFEGNGSCYVEIGGHLAAKGVGNFLAPPAPSVTLMDPSPEFHQEKQDEERAWLERWS
ncbi:NAD(P)/FAD-dependent oxidoreductase [Actinosynnema sp. NPDC091369]